MDSRESFIAWGKARGEDPVFLGQRWDRFQALIKNKDIWGQATMRAFLLTPREEFSAISPAIAKARLRACLPRYRLRRDHVQPRTSRAA